MTRPNQDDVLGAIVATLREIVAPEVTSPYARARLHTAIHAIRRMRERKSSPHADAIRRVRAARSFLLLAADLGVPPSFRLDDERSTVADQMAMDRSPDEIEHLEGHLMDQIAGIVDLVNDNPSLHRNIEEELGRFLLEYTSIDV